MVHPCTTSERDSPFLAGLVLSFAILPDNRSDFGKDHSVKCPPRYHLHVHLSSVQQSCKLLLLPLAERQMKASFLEQRLRDPPELQSQLVPRVQILCGRLEGVDQDL